MDNTDNRIKQIKALKNEKGIQYLLDAAYAILGNPLLLFNTEYSLQAHTNVTTDDPLWNELVQYGNFSYESQVLFKEEGFIDAVANTETVVLLISDKLKYDRMLGKLYNENKLHVANLLVTACNKPFEDDEAIVLEALCKVFSKEIMKNEFYKVYGNIYLETYIQKLIDGKIEDKRLYAAHIADIYSGFESSMRLVVADIGKRNPKYSKLAYFKDLFSQAQSNFGYAIYSNYVLVIVHSEDDLEFNAKRVLKKLYKIFEQHNIYAGISNSFDNLYELRKHYDEAVSALRNGLKNHGNQLIYLYNGAE